MTMREFLTFFIALCILGAIFGLAIAGAGWLFDIGKSSQILLLVFFLAGWPMLFRIYSAATDNGDIRSWSATAVFSVGNIVMVVALYLFFTVKEFTWPFGVASMAVYGLANLCSAWIGGD